jgi:hypothetical protein
MSLPVKSASTTVPATRTKSELEEMLRKYGASGFTVSSDYASRTVVVAFMMPRTFQDPRDQVEIKIPISYVEVEKRLVKLPGNGRKDSAWLAAQSERVAWRQLYILCEAALMAAAIGLQTLEEAFFAHQMLSLPNGGTLRAIDAATMAFRQLKAGT